VREIVDVWVDLFRAHNLLTYASAVALQALVAAVALILFGLGVLGGTGQEDVWNTRLGPQVQQRVLESVYAGMNDTVQRIFQSGSGGLIAFASLLAVWEVAGTVRAIMGALTQIYDAKETRPWWIRFPVSIGLSVAIIVGLAGAILLVASKVGPGGGALGVLAVVGRWVGAVVLLFLAFGLLVRYAPAEPRAKRWVSVGAGLVVVGWIVESLIFRWYVTSVANFKTAVGSLIVFLVVMNYFYVGSIILLVGIELDELLREDAKEAERGIHELVRELF